jgi:hypothetical protein
MGGRVLLTLAAAVSALLVTALPAGALTGGRVDGQAHPNVGLLVVDGSPACSGVLIAPKVFATAGHCGPDGADVLVTFDSTLDGDLTLWSGTLHVDPRFLSEKDDTHDLAVVTLDEAVPAAPAKLPSLGLLETLPAKTALTAVGYGVHELANGGGQRRLAFDGARRNGTLGLKSLKDAEASVAPLEAGLCFGDSGGPLLLGDTVVSLVSHGNRVCEGNSRTYRLDRSNARAFLSQFVALP